MKRIAVIICAASLAGLSGMAAAQTGGPAQTADTSKGKALADAKGMTLYTFDRDTAEKSNCTGQCAQNWPPFVAAADAKPAAGWTVVTREDGSKQWAYKGRPLYTWVKDTKKGDVTGDGVNGIWRIAKP